MSLAKSSCAGYSCLCLQESLQESRKNKTEICFGFAISFPSKSKSKSDENNVTYVVNNRYFKQEHQPSSSF